MANKTYGNYIIGVRDAKVATTAASTAYDVDAIQSVSMEVTFSSAVLTGDDVEKASVARPIGGSATFAAGAISDEALEIITGQSFTAAGSTPNETNTLQIDVNDNFPYFRFKAQAYDDETGAAVIFFPKCKVESGFSLSFEGDSWAAPEFTVKLFDDGSNGLFQLVQEETAAAISFS